MPGKHYRGGICPQDIGTEKALLDGTHPLSGTFDIIPMVVIDDRGNTAARGMLTFYEDEDTAYLGFFDCINDSEACMALITNAEKIARDHGKISITGPVDSSIWIGYRFKTDKFERACSAEPWNKPYYAELWEKCGFEVWKRYHSFRLNRITEKKGNPKYEARVESFRKKGYEYKNLDKKDFDRIFREIYELLIRIYASFPGYKWISYEAFYALFHKLKFILVPDDVMLIYKDGALAAFSISIPNFYENLFGKLTLTKLIRILKIRKDPKEMIYLYMGVDPSHLGLGSVIAELTRRELYENGRIPLKALILENKITASYYNDLLNEKMEYVLLRKKL